jgi:NADH:ubiquinone oxidoreductase subunit H
MICELVVGLYVCVLLVVLLFDSFRLPFDYLECESELVAGLVTEFSGLLFVVFSPDKALHNRLQWVPEVQLANGHNPT